MLINSVLRRRKKFQPITEKLEPEAKFWKKKIQRFPNLKFFRNLDDQEEVSANFFSNEALEVNENWNQAIKN